VKARRKRDLFSFRYYDYRGIQEADEKMKTANATNTSSMTNQIAIPTLPIVRLFSAQTGQTELPLIMVI